MVEGAGAACGVPAATTASAPATMAAPMMIHALSLVMLSTIVARH